MKNEDRNDLIDSLSFYRTEALGIGTNKIKRRLNKLIETNHIVKIIRTLIDVEDCNISAKKYSYSKYKNEYYNKKQSLISDLIILYKEHNYIYGRQKSDAIGIKDVIFFELPNSSVQVSFHTNLKENDVPEYTKCWDRKINSTMDKIFKYIKDNKLISLEK